MLHQQISDAPSPGFDAPDWIKSELAKLQAAPIAYSPKRAAEVTGRSRTRIFNAIKDRELTARKDGRATLIEHTELIRWVRAMPVAKAA